MCLPVKLQTLLLYTYLFTAREAEQVNQPTAGRAPRKQSRDGAGTSAPVQASHACCHRGENCMLCEADTA